MVLLIYRILINLVLLFLPIIILVRILKKKEHPVRVLEKVGFFSKKRKKGNLIWFHGASVGEVKSVIPLLEKLEKNPKINQILITSNTLSSSKIISALKLKKIVHQFFPIDASIIINKFLKYWKPNKAAFIDSEIWPNTILKLHEMKVPTILLNARITKKSFKRWNFFPNFSKKIFSKIDKTLSSSRDTLKFLKKLNVKNIEKIGNLKFSQSNVNRNFVNENLERYLKSKKIWCASSTHYPEEKICGKVHLNLKKKKKNLITIIIPRHIHRCVKIKAELEREGLIVHLTKEGNNLPKNIDILLINSFGKTNLFFKYSSHVFLGGSLINHGGQNPIEPAISGCNILHGPNIQNFKEIYQYLKKNKISNKVNNKNQLTKTLTKLFSENKKSNYIKKKIMLLGKDILEKTYKQINI